MNTGSTLEKVSIVAVLATVLISVFFGTEYYQPFFLGTLGVVLALNIKRIPSLKIIWVWMVCLTALFLSLLFSTFLPISVSAWAGYAGMCISFCLGLALPKVTSFLNSKFVLFGIIVIGVLQTGVVYMELSPSYVPDGSLFLEVFGHSPLVTLLLFFLPVVLFRLAHSSSRKEQMFNIVLFLSLEGLVLASLSRTAIVLQAVLLLFSAVMLRKKSIYAITTLAVLLVIVSAWIFSSETCYFETIQPQRCAGLEKQKRSEYWNQAIQAILDKPVFGYGPGTYSIISQKFAQSPYHYTHHPHSIVLETLAENGVMSGSLLLGLIVHPLFVGLRNNDRTSANFWLLVGCILVLIYNVFNSSFGYLPIQMLFFVLLGTVYSANVTKKRSPIWLIPIFLSVLVISLMMLYLYSVQLVRNKDISRSFKVFPYFASLQQYYILSDSNSLQESGVYKHNSAFYPRVHKIDSLESMHSLRSIDFWRYLNLVSVGQASSMMTADQLLEDIQIREMKFAALQPHIVVPGHTPQLRAQAYMSAGLGHLHSDLELALQMVLIAEQTDQKIVSESSLSTEKLTDQQNLTLWTQFAEHPIENLGANAPLSNQLIEFITKRISELSQEEFQLLLNYYLKHNSWEYQDVWMDLSQASSNLIDESILTQDTPTAQDVVEKWRIVHTECLKYGQDLKRSNEENLAEQLIVVGNLSIENQLGVVGDNYSAALDLHPQVLDTAPLWYEMYGVDFADQELIELSESIDEYVDNFSSSEHADEFMYLYYRAATIAGDAGKTNDQEYYLTLVQQSNPGNYWAELVLGTFYLNEKRFLLSISEFERCLSVYPEHQHCKNGLHMAQKQSAPTWFIENIKSVIESQIALRFSQ